MSTVIAVLGAAFAFFLVVMVHECGHYFVARLCGVKVLQFSIGFGKEIYSRTGKSGVRFVLRLLPLGGYVQMADTTTDENSLSDEGSSGTPFHKHSILTRVAVVIAGPVINIILAVFLFWLLFIVGVQQIKPIIGQVRPNSIAAHAMLKPRDQIQQVGNWRTDNWRQVMMSLVMHLGDKKPLSIVTQNDQQTSINKLDLASWHFDPTKPTLLSSIGIVPQRPVIKPLVAKIVADSPAQNKLKKDDLILAFNKKNIHDWHQLVLLIQKHPNETVSLRVRRGEEIKNVMIKIGAHTVGEQTLGYLGVMPVMPKIPASLKSKIQYGWVQAWLPAWYETWRLIVFHFVVIKQMVLGRISLKALGGPITIFKSAGIASKAGFQVYVGFLALISVILGVLNILPIPGLDGGHLLFLVIEAVIGRPLPERAQSIIIVFGIGLLISLMVYATLNDLIRLF